MECFGVPLQAWSMENLKKIGEQWGTVVAYDEQTINKLSSTSSLILMDTCYHSPI